MPWLQATLWQRMHAMLRTGQPFTLPGTNVPAAAWHVERRASQSPQVKSMNSIRFPPWICAPSWCESSLGVRAPVAAEALGAAVRVARDLDVVRVLADLDRVRRPAPRAPVALDLEDQVDGIAVAIAAAPAPDLDHPGVDRAVGGEVDLDEQRQPAWVAVDPVVARDHAECLRAREPGVRAHDARARLAAGALADHAQRCRRDPSQGSDRAHRDRVAAAAEDPVDRRAACGGGLDQGAVERDAVAHGALDGAPADGDGRRRRRVHADDRLRRRRRRLSHEDEREGCEGEDGEESRAAGGRHGARA